MPRYPRIVWIKVLLMLLLGLPIGFQSWSYFQRPARQSLSLNLATGVHYERIIMTQPRPNVVHVVQIDLTLPPLKLLVTPGMTPPDGHYLNALTTSQFLTRYQQDFAINGNFFHPFQENAPWNYYPKVGDRVHSVGYAASNGQVYSTGEYVPDWVVVCFDRQNQVQILPQSNCPAGTQQGLSGNELILPANRPSTLTEKDKPYPRTIVGTDATGKQLWLVVIDGKQPWYSEGMTIAETRPLLAKLGITTALNLDGGGSVTMVRSTPTGPQVLNAPMQNKIPMNQRPIANHLGLRWH
jgi:Phosphodiester glycosidase